MSAAVNNVASTDGWTELSAPSSARLELNVTGAAIYYQLGEGQPPLYSQPEKFQVPVLAHLDRVCDSIRFRSAVAGVPARVTIQAMTAGEAGGG